MYMSCSSLVCESEDRPNPRDVPYLKGILKKIKALEFQTFDLAAIEGWQHVDPSMLVDKKGFAKDLADMILDSGLTVSSFNCSPSKLLIDPDPSSFERYKKEYAALLDLAVAVKCPHITVQPSCINERDDVGKLIDLAASHLSDLSLMNGDSGVTLSIEPHCGSLIQEPARSLELMKKVWPHTGLTYDPSHFVLQGFSLEDTEIVMDYTLHAHIRNASTGKMQDTMANGTVDVPWVMTALRRHGYDGVLAIEYVSGFDRTFENTMALKQLMIECGAHPQASLK